MLRVLLNLVAVASMLIPSGMCACACHSAAKASSFRAVSERSCTHQSECPESPANDCPTHDCCAKATSSPGWLGWGDHATDSPQPSMLGSEAIDGIPRKQAAAADDSHLPISSRTPLYVTLRSLLI